MRRGGGGLVTALSGPRLPPRRALDRLGDDRRGHRGLRGTGRPGRDRDRRDRLPAAAGRQRRRRLRPLLQRDRQPDPLVRPALPLGPLQRAGHPPAGARRLGLRLPGGQSRHRRRGARPDRRARAAAGDAPRLPPLHGAGDDPRRAARRLPPPLRPHPLVAAGQLAGPAGSHPRGDLPRHARQRHHRLPHPRLLHQLHPLLRRTARGRRRLRPLRHPPRRRPDALPRLPAGDRRRAPAAGRGGVAGGRRGRARACSSAAAST